MKFDEIFLAKTGVLYKIKPEVRFKPISGLQDTTSSLSALQKGR